MQKTERKPLFELGSSSQHPAHWPLLKNPANSPWTSSHTM
jgi:hypothetical protein